MASSIIALLGTYALLTAQIPVDETNAQSTIKVKKKEPKEEETPEPPPPPVAKKVTVQKTEAPVMAKAPPPPLPKIAPPAPALAVQSNAGKPVKVLPWVTLGASLAATAVGIFFAVRTTKILEDQAELEFEINTSKSRVNIPDEFTDNQKAVFVNSITATVLISAGISGAVASSVALSMD